MACCPHCCVEALVACCMQGLVAVSGNPSRRCTAAALLCLRCNQHLLVISLLHGSCAPPGFHNPINEPIVNSLLRVVEAVAANILAQHVLFLPCTLPNFFSPAKSSSNVKGMGSKAGLLVGNTTRLPILWESPPSFPWVSQHRAGWHTSELVEEVDICLCHDLQLICLNHHVDSGALGTVHARWRRHHPSIWECKSASLLATRHKQCRIAERLRRLRGVFGSQHATFRPSCHRAQSRLGCQCRDRYEVWPGPLHSF